MVSNRTYLQSLSENIRESLSYVQSHILVGCPEDKIKNLINLVESFVITADVEGDSEFIKEGKDYESELFKSIKVDSAMRKIFEYGFENPFDTDNDDKMSVEKKIGFDNAESSNSRPMDPKDIQIKRIKLWSRETKDKIILDDDKIFAGQYFDKGDIIERCPCEYINKGLYTEDVIEKIAFKADGDTNVYVIPFGYANSYRNSIESRIAANADYSFGTIRNKPYITIFAISKIRKGDEIVLKADESDFENVIKPGQFKYNDGPEYVPTKNFKILA